MKTAYVGKLIVVGLLLAAGFLAGRGLGPKAEIHQHISNPVVSGKVGFEPARVDLGAHLWDTELPFSVNFVNGGRVPLTVSSVSASCDCMVMEAESFRGFPVSAGATIEITGTLKTGKHAGALVRSLTLTTSSDEHYTASLYIDVTGTWRVSTDSLDLGEIEIGAGTPVPLEQLFTFTGDPDELLESPVADVGWIECHEPIPLPAATRIRVLAWRTCAGFTWVEYSNRRTCAVKG